MPHDHFNMPHQWAADGIPSECQSDSNIVGGPRDHSPTTIGILHIEYPGVCTMGGICAAHLAPTVAFVVSEQSDSHGTPFDLVSISLEFNTAIAGQLAVVFAPHPEFSINPLELWRDGFYARP